MRRQMEGFAKIFAALTEIMRRSSENGSIIQNLK
jgi:hypothetical protein